MKIIADRNYFSNQIMKFHSFLTQFLSVFTKLSLTFSYSQLIINLNFIETFLVIIDYNL